MTKTSFRICHLFGILALVVPLTAFLWGCSKAPAPTPGNTTQDVTPGSTDHNEEIDNSDKTGDKSAIANPTGESLDTCKSNCKGQCTSYHSACVTGANANGGNTTVCDNDLAACNSTCDNATWDQGGCADIDLGYPKGDNSVKIEVGMKSVPVVVRHCTHAVDSLTIQYGTMAFAAQQGVPAFSLLSFMVRRPSWWWAWNPWAWIISSIRSTSNLPMTMAATGFSDGARSDATATTRAAKVTIGGTDYVWPYPAAVSFNIASKISGGVDMSRSTKIVRRTVDLVADQGIKSSHWYHKEDYFSAGAALDVMTYYRAFNPFNTSRTNCEFVTTFDFFYHPESSN